MYREQSMKMENKDIQVSTNFSCQELYLMQVHLHLEFC